MLTITGNDELCDGAIHALARLLLSLGDKGYAALKQAAEEKDSSRPRKLSTRISDEAFRAIISGWRKIDPLRRGVTIRDARRNACISTAFVLAGWSQLTNHSIGLRMSHNLCGVDVDGFTFAHWPMSDGTLWTVVETVSREQLERVRPNRRAESQRRKNAAEWRSQLANLGKYAHLLKGKG